MSDAETTEQGASAAKAGPKKGVLIGVVAGAALVGLGAGAFAVAPAIAPKPAGAAEPHAAEGSGGEHGEPGADSTSAAAAPTVLTNLVVNPAGSRGTRFLLVSVGFDFKPAVPNEEFEKRETEIRDRVLETLGTKTVDELVDYTRRDAFREEIRVVVDSILGESRTRRVFFPQFVIQ